MSEAASLREDFWIYTILARAQLEFDPRRALISAEKALEIKPDWIEAEEVRKKALKKIESIGGDSGSSS